MLFTPRRSWSSPTPLKFVFWDDPGAHQHYFRIGYKVGRNDASWKVSEAEGKKCNNFQKFFNAYLFTWTFQALVVGREKFQKFQMEGFVSRVEKRGMFRIFMTMQLVKFVFYLLCTFFSSHSPVANAHCWNNWTKLSIYNLFWCTFCFCSNSHTGPNAVRWGVWFDAVSVLPKCP